MIVCPEERIRRSWQRLAIVWALYYFAAFTLGQIPQFVQRTIWMGAGLVAVATVPVLWRHVRLRDLPREGVLLICFSLWAMLGGVFVSDAAMFRLFLKLVLELTMIVTVLSLVMERSGSMQWLYLAYFGVAIFRVVYGQGPISFDRIADTRVVERIAGANAVGFYCVLGIIGMLALMQEVKSLWLRGGLAAGGVIALYGVVLSASRGAFVALIATAVLWPVLCMVGGSRDKSKAVAGALVVLVLAYWMFQFVVESTYLGVRFTNATQLEDGSSQTRLELFLTGLRVFAQNPIFGTGLGQFGVVSRTGHYAHNEFAEIIATTGLPGFLMYFSIYLLVWRRLSGCLRRVADPLIAYRINMARLIVLILVLSGFLSRPNFIAQDTMFLLGLVVGVSHWAERTVRLAAGQGAAAAAPAWAATGWEAPGWGPPAPAGWGAGFSGSPMAPAASGLPASNRRT